MKLIASSFRLGEIRVPVFNDDAAGGFGLQAERTFDLLGSTDITRLTVQLHSPGEVALD